MKVSINAVKQLCAVYGVAEAIIPDDIGALVQKIGAQLGAVETIEATGAKYAKAVIVRVVSCEPHPNADKLNVCLIDDGGVTPDVARTESGLVEVVCGAPNVAKDLLVVWLPPGATVPSSFDTDPFVLEARELRGIVSNGMLASPKELAIGDSHEGLLVVDKEVDPGVSFADTYNMNDYIIDIENKMFTHRPDCFGLLGVARELAGIQQQPFTSPEWYVVSPAEPVVAAEELPLVIRNELPELVSRFTAITMRDVKVAPSPVWLQAFLSRIGMKSINNIVDLTNYYMYLTGQPLHAYDYDKVAARSDGEATIVVRAPKPSEKIALLNGKTIEPRQEAIMIATDQELIGIGGVMGGSDTEVDETTKNIIIECASFDMYSIRRTSMAHGLFTDAVTRFTKGQSPLQTKAVLCKMTEDVQRMAGGKVASSVYDEFNAHEPTVVQVSTSFVNERLGLSLSSADIMSLLSNVEFQVGESEGLLTITVPFWRTDIALPEDIVEEIGRLYGYDKLPLELPGRSITPVQKNQLYETRATIRRILSKAGANEVLTYSFVHGDLLKKVGQDPERAFELSNALSPDLQYYRLSLTPSLLDNVHMNIKAGHDAFALFELGTAHHNDQLADDGLPIERTRLGFVLAANEKAVRQGEGAAYYQAKHYLMHLLQQLGITGTVVFEPLVDDTDVSATVYYAPGRSATVRVGSLIIGRVGEYKRSVQRALKLPDYTAGFELGLKPLAEVMHDSVHYVPLPKFPSITQDITLRVSNDIPYQQVHDCVQNALLAVQPAHVRSVLHPVSRYQAATEGTYTNSTFRLEIASYDKTMRDSEVTELLNDVTQVALDTIGAERV